MLEYYALLFGSAVLLGFANVINCILLALKSVTIFEQHSVFANLVLPLIYFLKSISQSLNSFNISHVFYSIHCLWNLFYQAHAIAYYKGNLKCSESACKSEDTKALAFEWIKLQVAAFNCSPVYFSYSGSLLLNLMSYSYVLLTLPFSWLTTFKAKRYLMTHENILFWQMAMTPF